METNWDLVNHNFDKDILLSVILQKYGDFPVLQENPILFKHFSDIWWAKYYRTFQKWFDAFDLPYHPLENYNINDEKYLTENENGNQFNKHVDTDHITSAHIGDNKSNSNTVEEHEDHDTINETYEGDTSGHKVGTSESNIDTRGTKQSDTGEDWSEDKTTDTTIDFDETSNQTNTNTNTSGRMIPQYDSEGHIIGYTLVENTERTLEHGVSAYDEGNSSVSPYAKTNYAPSSLDITHGSLTDSGSNNSTKNVKTNNTPGANRITEATDGSKDTDYIENTTGNEQSANFTQETTTGTNDHTLDNNKDNEGGSNTTVNTNSQDKSNDYTENNRSGNSQLIKDLSHDLTENIKRHGKLGLNSVQNLLKNEIKIQLFTIYDQMAELFVDDNCICIFNSSKGGCCLW